MTLAPTSTEVLGSVPNRVPLSFLASSLAANVEKPASRTWLAFAQLHEVRQHLLWCFYRAAKTAVHQVQRTLFELPDEQRKTGWDALKGALTQYRGKVNEEITRALSDLAGSPTLLLIDKPPGRLQGMCMWSHPDPREHTPEHTRIECLAVVLTDDRGPLLRRCSVPVPSHLLNNGSITLAAAKLVAESAVHGTDGVDQPITAEGPDCVISGLVELGQPKTSAWEIRL